MPTTLTIMWQKAPTPGLIPLCSLYRPKFGTSAPPQRDLLANDQFWECAGCEEVAAYIMAR
jgi:hypothetical protein